MNLDLISTFMDVVRRGSLAAVARERSTDPSTISRMIAALEKELGFRLLQRTTRRLSLTEAGQLYLGRVEPLLKELETARDQARTLSGAPSGRLRLTASVAFGQVCLLPLLPRFRAEFPDIQIELLLSDKNLDTVADQVDLAIRLGHAMSGDLISTKLFATHYRVCASPDYLEGHGALSSPSELSGRRCLLFDLPDYRGNWIVRGPQGEISQVPVAGDIVISSALALRQAALDGLGPALLADWMTDADLAGGRLIDMLPDHAVAASSFETAAWLLYANRNYLPQKIRVTIDFLKRHLRRDDR